MIDFAFAIALGVVFQYYSIAPMAGDYGLNILWRAAKADFLSLLFFEVGLFGWMAIFQIAIFQWKLEMNTVTYWWMMQVCFVFDDWYSGLQSTDVCRLACSLGIGLAFLSIGG